MKLDLCELQNGLPAITPAFGAALAEAGAICLIVVIEFSQPLAEIAIP
ncbi:hypothetical protein PN462_15550 [Spirulina sp. CS-785/01]|nr:hypothetical protein [Spirulina sp. CS-785/01]MDB9314527.1 hypothetical protein [Spirulina sp. CS-785/01]